MKTKIMKTSTIIFYLSFIFLSFIFLSLFVLYQSYLSLGLAKEALDNAIKAKTEIEESQPVLPKCVEFNCMEKIESGWRNNCDFTCIF